MNTIDILEKIIGSETAHAHCDVPCGIYEPYFAQVAALTVIRMIDIIADQQAHGMTDTTAHNNLIRAVTVKEEHAERVKHEVTVLWGDYFKAEHFEKYPHLHTLVNDILKLASKSKQGVKREDATSMLAKVNELAKIFYETKGKETKEVKYPKPEETIIVPV